MKKMRVFAAICFMLMYSANYINAQQEQGTKKDAGTISQVVCLTAQQIECLTETICGNLDFVDLNINDKRQIKRIGIFIGEDSHDIYTYELLNNVNNMYVSWPASAKSYVQIITIRREGVLIARVQYTGHLLYSNNGFEIEFEHFKCDCK